MSRDHDTSQEWGGQSHHSPPANKDDFSDLSVVLTGFTIDVISPLDHEGIELLQKYFDTARVNTGHVFNDLVAQYVQLVATHAPGKQPADMTAAQKQAIGAAIFAPPTSQTALTARAILKMWYLGSWYQPFEFNGKQPDLAGGVVVSGSSYALGLSWQVMQSHAMGYSDSAEFGAWRHDPPPLSAFLTGG